MRPGCAVFDFDGTLFDSMYIWEHAGEMYLRSMGREPEPGLQSLLLPMSLDQSAGYLKKAYSLDLSKEEIIRGINDTVDGFYVNDVVPKPGAEAFLSRMKSTGAAMCIATATDRPQIEATLKRCGLEGYFNAIFTCSEVGSGKDRPFIYRRAAEHFGAKKEDVLVFEDALHAARTAKNDGFKVAAVFDPSEKRQDELRALADYFIEDLRHSETFWKELSV